MDRLRIANRGPAWRILIAACGIALVVGAAVLIVRPLTALTGLVITLAAALVLAGVKVVGSRPRQPWRWIWAVLRSVLRRFFCCFFRLWSARCPGPWPSHWAIAATTGSILLTAGTARVDDYSGEVPAGAAAVRVLYTATYSDGSPALASAVVAYPTSPTDEPRPVLAWQHGTTGVARSCAPSAGPEALTEYAIPGISRAMERGWVVVATDYPGQGTPGRYPYLIGEGEGRATLDAIRAAQQIEDAHASLNAWIWGHSQGGHASLWAAQIAADYAPEVTIIGVAALSAASDPLMLSERITGGQSTALTRVVISLVLVPYADEYPDVSLASAVHPAGQGIVETFASRCVIERSTVVSVLVASALAWDAPLYRINVVSGPMHERLSQNIADGIVAAPLFLGQGIDDEVIPITMQRALDAKLCASGRTVETHEYPGRSHMGVIAEDSPLIDDLFAWADAVAAGAAPGNCGS